MGFVKSDITGELLQFKLHILTMMDAATHWIELATTPPPAPAAAQSNLTCADYVVIPVSTQPDTTMEMN